MKLLMLGFDAMDYQLSAEVLPEFDHFLMCSTRPALSPEAWTTIYTGMPPSKHRVGEFYTAVEYDKRGFETLTFKCFWNYLNEAGVKVELFNMPIAFPPRNVNRYMVSGFPGPTVDLSVPYTFPASLESELPDGYRDRVNVRAIILGETAGDWGGDLHRRLGIQLHEPITSEKLLPLAFEFGRERIDLFFEMHELDVEFGFIGFDFIDTCGHIGSLEQESDRKRVYEVAVDLARYAMSKIESENYMIISDHGCRKEGHTNDGVLFVTGKDFSPQSELLEFTVADVAPTVLHLFDIALPVGEDAMVQPPAYQLFPASNYESDAVIMQRLRALGYV